MARSSHMARNIIHITKTFSPFASWFDDISLYDSPLRRNLASVDDGGRWRWPEIQRRSRRVARRCTLTNAHLRHLNLETRPRRRCFSPGGRINLRDEII